MLPSRNAGTGNVTAACVIHNMCIENGDFCIDLTPHIPNVHEPNIACENPDGRGVQKRRVLETLHFQQRRRGQRR